MVVIIRAKLHIRLLEFDGYGWYIDQSPGLREECDMQDFLRLPQVFKSDFDPWTNEH